MNSIEVCHIALTFFTTVLKNIKLKIVFLILVLMSIILKMTQYS